MVKKTKLIFKDWTGLVLIIIGWMMFFLKTWDYVVFGLFAFSIFSLGHLLLRNTKSIRTMVLYFCSIIVWGICASFAIRTNNKPYIVGNYNTGIELPFLKPIPVWVKVVAAVCILCTIFLVGVKIWKDNKVMER